MKLVDGKVVDLEKDGRWVDVVELSEGGARVKIAVDDKECMTRLAEKLTQWEVVMNFLESEDGNWIIPIDETGQMIPFDTVMKALLG
jgi:hypothetical protein